MKKVLFFLFCITTICSYAQDVIVLKDGTTILSKVTEVSSSEIKYKKISNLDGPIFTIKSSDILSINYNNGEKDSFNDVRPQIEKYPISKEIKTGYCGFVDFGFTFGVGADKESRFDFSTSHGYRPFDYLFIGAGAQVSYWHEINMGSIPIFGNLRFDLPTHANICPFIDVKIGYTPWHFGGRSGFVRPKAIGVFYNLSLGGRIIISKRNAINVSIGYQAQQCNDIPYIIELDYHKTLGFKKGYRGGISTKIGIEF